MINQPITILLADDHEIFRLGVKQFIDNEKDMQVIATADNGKEAVEKAIALKPDVVLMDIAMPEMNGLEAAEELLSKMPTAKILLISLYDLADYVKQSLRIGVSGYVLKDAPNKVFLNAIRTVAESKFFYSGNLTNILLNEYNALKANTENKTDGASIAQKQRKLTEREIEILGQIATGVSNKDLALKYGVSTRTIETHRLNIMRKMQVNQIEAAIELALKQQIL